MPGSPEFGSREIRIAYISNVRLNPYVRLLAQGVHAADPGIQPLFISSLSWLRVLDWRLDLLHLHWAELQYRSTAEAEAAHRLNGFLRKLSLARRRRLPIVYTVHNLDQHEGLHPDLNRRVNHWLFQNADALHVHHAPLADQIRPRCKQTTRIYVVPHGNYIGAYPNQVGREEARRQLGIAPDRFVYLCLGQIRPYKGIDELIAAFVQQALPDALLLLAGHIGAAGYGDHVRALAAGHPNIRLDPHYIEDHRLQLYFNAADVCVLPYRHATTSGAALLAFSFGRPVIAPNLGPFPELIGSERGLLFSPAQEGLAQALGEARKLDLVAAGRRALAYAAALDWTTLGGQHAAVYRSLLS